MKIQIWFWISMAKWAKWAFKDEFRLSTCSSLRSLQGGIFDGSILWFLKALKNGLNGLTNIISKSIIYDGFLKQASISWELENRSPLNKALAKKRKKLPGIFFLFCSSPNVYNFFIIVFWKLCNQAQQSSRRFSEIDGWLETPSSW